MAFSMRFSTDHQTFSYTLIECLYKPNPRNANTVCYSVNGQVIDIDTCSTFSTKTRECQRGDKALPSGDYTRGIDMDALKKLFTTKEAIKIACKSTNKEKYRAAAVCIADSYRHCADNDFKTLILTGEKYGEAIDFACDNETADHILNCLSDSYNDCTANKIARGSYTTSIDRSKPFSDYKEYYCGVAQIEEECARDDIDVQECLDTGTYDKFVQLRNILRPTACGASAIIFTASLLFASLIASLFH
ncbi:hypothetical protein LOTGIDRAFT_163554 [Lottia gigantea]|uniref:Uncharacterized protein n=1 Tax=Lottia gigantea TaxID=225164 RepID=V4ACJ7_LOTGI|nr:hypothetical protein LOTGIDRAFT_163554 [Lottia gigantea]ESO91036.1 hypothetical protein LOTGIDRAFT_163554 [Lottia gigantea]